MVDTRVVQVSPVALASVEGRRAVVALEVAAQAVVEQAVGGLAGAAMAEGTWEVAETAAVGRAAAARVVAGMAAVARAAVAVEVTPAAWVEEGRKALNRQQTTSFGPTRRRRPCT